MILMARFSVFKGSTLIYIGWGCLSCWVSGYYSLSAYRKTVRNKINKKYRDKIDKWDKLNNRLK